MSTLKQTNSLETILNVILKQAIETKEKLTNTSNDKKQQQLQQKLNMLTKQLAQYLTGRDIWLGKKLS